MENAKTFFSTADRIRISDAIKAAERNTSGEIRVHLENHCKGDALRRAEHIFDRLNMHKTKDRTGVLFYLAVKDHQFSIYGDQGINSKVPANFWHGIKDHMLICFKETRFADGLCDGIGMAGEQLGKHFPLQRNDANELSNEISEGKI